MTAAYFWLLCIANRLPVEINVHDHSAAMIPITIQYAVANSSSRLGNLDSTLSLPKISIPGYALAMCAEVLKMPYIAPAEITAISTNATRVGVFSPLDLSQGSAAIPSTTTESQNTVNPLDTPTIQEDLRISPFREFESADDLNEFFQGMTRAKLIVHTRLIGAESSPFGENTTNAQIISSLVNRIISLHEDDEDNETTPQDQPSRTLDSETLRASVQATLYSGSPGNARSRSIHVPVSRSASDNMRMAQMVVDINRLIIATRIVMPSLFTKNVYVSISSFDTVTMQGVFSFLDT